MPSPYNSVRSKLNRAICAWLVNQACGSVDDVLPANGRKARAFPNTTVRSAIAKPEAGFGGSERVQVMISIKGSATQAPSEPNPAAARTTFDARVGTTKDALMLTDDQQTLRYTAAQITIVGRALAVPVDASPAAAQVAANNADMVDFTCQQWYPSGEGDGEAEDPGCDWEEILLFEAVACCANVD